MCATMRSELRIPDFYSKMIERNGWDDKTKGGFYQSPKAADGKEERLALDWKTSNTSPRTRPKAPALEMAKNVEDAGARVRMLLGLEGQWGRRKATRPALSMGRSLGSLTYAANRVPENLRHRSRNRVAP